MGLLERDCGGRPESWHLAQEGHRRHSPMNASFSGM